MTSAMRNPDGFTEFSRWLRSRRELDSNLGYVATNIDYMWKNYKTSEWMLIEEKRYCKEIRRWQQEMFATINFACSNGDSKYCGFHTLVFENTNPDDGRMWLDGIEISIDELILFLQFQWRPSEKNGPGNARDH